MSGGYAKKMLPGEKAKDFKGTILRLCRYIRPFAMPVAVAFAMVIMSTVFGVISPTLLGNATDMVVAGVKAGEFNYNGLLRILFVLLFLYACSWFFEAAQGWITATVSQKVIYKLRKEMSEKLDRLPVSYFDNIGHGEIQSRMVNDIETVNQTLNSSISHMITAIVTLAGVLVMMIRINLLMTVVAVMVVPVSMLIMRFVVRKSQGYFRQQQSYMGKLNNHVEEMLTGHVEIKLCNGEDGSIEKFEEFNEGFGEASKRAQIVSGLVTPAAKLMGNIGYVIACLMGGWLALKGQISIGQIQAFIHYVGTLNMPVQQVANIANQLQSTAAAAERIFGLLDEEDEENPWNETNTEENDS